MNLLYKSTRDAEKTVTASQAILKGLADDGGVFLCAHFVRGGGKPSTSCVQI